MSALALVAAAACAGGQHADRVEPGRDVILVVVDTLRADHVGVLGQAPHPATPEIDRLARRGRWCTEAWSSAPWTPPSVMTLLTSLEPPVHGLELAGDRLTGEVPGLPPGASTMAEVLRAAGYRTLAVTAGGGVGAALGFDRGFDRYHEPQGRPDTDVEAGVDVALSWLAEERNEPLFLFFHTYEVHQPNTHEVFTGGDDPVSTAVAAYDSDLAVADRHLGRLFAALDRSGRLARAVVVVTSDHGENLHDRILAGRPVEHGHHLYAELLRVPLVVVAPGLVAAAGAIAVPVQLLDVLPTVCSLVGIDPASFPHQGRDLRPVLQGWGRVEPPLELYAWAPLQGPTWRALRTPDWTCIVAPPVSGGQWWREVAVPAVALHDRRLDAHELTSASEAHAEVTRALSLRLDQRRAAALALRAALGGGDTMVVDNAAALRALGYLDREAGPGE
jgi:arylsulfatase A-like enzyme